jgi:hypothetical protein
MVVIFVAAVLLAAVTGTSNARDVVVRSANDIIKAQKKHTSTQAPEYQEKNKAAEPSEKTERQKVVAEEIVKDKPEIRDTRPESQAAGDGSAAEDEYHSFFGGLLDKWFSGKK